MYIAGVIKEDSIVIELNKIMIISFKIAYILYN